MCWFPNLWNFLLVIRFLQLSDMSAVPLSDDSPRVLPNCHNRTKIVHRQCHLREVWGKFGWNFPQNRGTTHRPDQPLGDLKPKSVSIREEKPGRRRLFVPRHGKGIWRWEKMEKAQHLGHFSDIIRLKNLFQKDIKVFDLAILDHRFGCLFGSPAGPRGRS